MIWYAAGLVWLLQIVFWGLGLALLAAPARWRRFWPAFCAPAGLALQSLVVWIGAHTRLPGTDTYALVSQAIPAGLLLAAWLHLRRRGTFWRVLAGAWRWWAVGLLMVGSLTLQAYPFTKPPARLTSTAIGSCDAADYAAGARVFKEFARQDRSGFLGDTAIAQTLSVDNFFDFWLRINHFSPSAVIALNASLCGRQPYELTSLLGLVLLTLHLPGVFWLTRSAFRFRPTGSLAVTAIYGFSPAMYYTVYQTALGQLMATPAVMLLTWAGWQAFRGPRTWARLTGWSALLMTGDWLLFGSYNFFILFAYIPLLAYAGLRALRTRDWAGAARWAVLVGANLVVCAILFPDRVMSVVERFTLFNKTPFGWQIPGFWPSGWFGAFADPLLHPADVSWATALAVVGLAASVVTAYREVSRGRGRPALLAACCTLPILLGYWYLLREDRLRHDHASYDAFKLFAVFYPGILAALCLWLRGPHPSWPGRIGAAAGWAILLWVNMTGVSRYDQAIRRSPFTVVPNLAAISEIERLPEVNSVNITMEQVWERLWANGFLLHKKQCFAVPTYEGRPVTALRVGWDLTERLVVTRSPERVDLLEDNRSFALLRHDRPQIVDASLDGDWNTLEHVRGEAWCWAKGSPTVRIVNPGTDPLAASLTLSLLSQHERHLQICVGEQVLWEGLTGPTTRVIAGVPLALPPGVTLLNLRTPEAPDRSPGDTRLLTFRLGYLEVDLPSGRPPLQSK